MCIDSRVGQQLSPGKGESGKVGGYTTQMITKLQ